MAFNEPTLRVTHQLRSLSARVVCKKVETFIAVTLEEDHTGRWVAIPERNEALDHE